MGIDVVRHGALTIGYTMNMHRKRPWEHLEGRNLKCKDEVGFEVHGSTTLAMGNKLITDDWFTWSETMLLVTEWEIEKRENQNSGFWDQARISHSWTHYWSS